MEPFSTMNHGFFTRGHMDEPEVEAEVNKMLQQYNFLSPQNSHISAFFEVPTWTLWAKVAILRGQKMALPVPVQKIREHFILQTFPQNKDYDN